MNKITIDDIEYVIDELSDEAKAQLASIRYVDNELVNVQMQVAALQTARNAYGRALKQILEEGKSEDEERVSIDGLGDNIEFEN